MKKILSLALFVLLSTQLFSQTDGITYQAVIIGPDNQELPGVDAQGNILPEATVAIRFTILDENNAIEYQEVQTTNTDQYGRINLLIGDANPDGFKQISWDGTNKNLNVEVDFTGGSDYVDLSRERLTFLPFALHRNIKATGTLTVDDATFLNSELTVQGPTILNSTLDVENNNTSNLTGDLNVKGATVLDSTLLVNNKNMTHLTGELNVGEEIIAVVDGPYDEDAPTKLNGTLEIVGQTFTNGLSNKGTFSSATVKTDSLIVPRPGTASQGISTLEGVNTLLGQNIIGAMTDSTFVKGKFNIESTQQIKINSTVSSTTNSSNDTDINKYPLLVEGSTQGIAIKVNGSRNNENNFISFWDESNGVEPVMWGRIEGETPIEFVNNADYIFDQSSLDYDIYDADLDFTWALVDVAVTAADLACALADVRPCIGFGVCATTPGPVDIAFAIAEVVIVGVKLGYAVDAQNRANGYLTAYNNNKQLFKGVTYASGSGDYAEYLLRSNVNEIISYGDIVGTIGGKISKNTVGSEKMMVVSFKPIVLGNMPQPNREKDYEKVAFMGQVPVKVFGKVSIGDYIVPSGNNDGLGRAISPSKINSKDIKKIVGVAWEASEQKYGLKLINIAVGINTNDNNPIVERLEKQVLDQDRELNKLKDLLTKTIERLVIVENKASSDNSNLNDTNNDEIATTGIASDGRKYEIENEYIYYEITDADIERGLKLAEQMINEEGLDTKKQSVLNKLKEDPIFKQNLNKSLKEKFDKQIHIHKVINKQARH